MSGTLDRYRIVKELGRGGMGVVYRAKDPLLGREVAIKRLLRNDEEMIERFLSEAKSLAALIHPNIIQIFDIRKDREGLFIITEFVDGIDLDQFVKSRKRLSLSVVCKLIVPICQALGYAHDKNVIHRDIKPANILLTRDGAPKIADFGLARIESMKELEMTGIIMGTRAYGSPEQFSDAKHLDHRTDIYSVGAMMYNMATGKSPQFFRETDIPDPIRPIVSRAMQHDPNRRYQKLDAMIEDINALKTPRPQESLLQSPPGEASPAGRPAALFRSADEMILIPAGSFRYGPEGLIGNLPAFYIDKYPVTNAQFARITPGHTFAPEQADHPATRVTWLEANAYARKLGKRLPSEMEWEKAARGNDGRLFPWGNQFSPDRCNVFESRIGSTTPVNAYPEGQSPYGVMDMAGNVWEWTSNYLDERRTARILKGGAHNGESKFALCHAKFAYPEAGLLPTAGFRCAKSGEPGGR